MLLISKACKILKKAEYIFFNLYTTAIRRRDTRDPLTATVVPFFPTPLVSMPKKGWRRFRNEKHRTTETNTIFSLMFTTGSWGMGEWGNGGMDSKTGECESQPNSVVPRYPITADQTILVPATGLLT